MSFRSSRLRFTFGVLLLTSVSVCIGPAAADRPNIVMAFADDWGKYASVYGKLSPGGINDVVSTPHFDAIAADGVLFTNAYVSAPSCTPCRSSLLSGQHFWRCGRASILQGSDLEFFQSGLPAAAGKIGLSHRSHLQGLEPRCSGRRAPRRQANVVQSSRSTVQRFFAERNEGGGSRARQAETAR